MKRYFLACFPLPHCPRVLPVKFRENPLGYLKCLFTAPYTSREVQAFAASKRFFETGMGYYAEQSTRP